MKQKLVEEFAESDEAERQRLLSAIESRLQEAEDVFAASSSSSGSKSYIRSSAFLRVTATFLEDLTIAKDLDSKRSYFSDYCAEVKRAAAEKRDQRRVMRQMVEEAKAIKARAGKVPLHLTKKGYEKKQAQLKAYRKRVCVLRRKLDKYQSAEIDLVNATDEQLDGSSYMKAQLATKEILKLEKKISELEGFSVKVPRQLTRKFKYSGSGEADVDAAVVAFMNKRFRSTLFDAPCIDEVADFIKTVRPKLPASELDPLVLKVFTDICTDLKQRRYAESMDVLHGYESDEDQAEFELPETTDLELQVKLEKNDELKTTEEQVLQTFVDRWSKMSESEQQKDAEGGGSETGSEKGGDDDKDGEEGRDADSSEEEEAIVLSETSSDSSDDEEETEAREEPPDGKQDDGDDVASVPEDGAKAEALDACEQPQDCKEPQGLARTPADSAGDVGGDKTNGGDGGMAASCQPEDEVPISPASTEKGNGFAKKPPTEDIESITLESDDEETERPKKKQRLGSSSEAARDGLPPMVPMDWKPAVAEPTVIDLSSDED